MCGLDLSASITLSNLGRVLPQVWGRHYPTPIPHPGLTVTPGKNGSVIRRQDPEGQRPGLQRGCQPQWGHLPASALQPWGL